MLFNSLQYAVFLPMTIILYFILPHKFRWLFMLIASFFFYMCWDAKYALLLLMSIITTYFTALLLQKVKKASHKKLILFLCLIINLGTLFLFKYFNFFSATIAGAFHLLGVEYVPVKLSLLLPIGISFYTFQVLGYIIDVYKGRIQVQKHFGKYALFVSFFPQILAGPIGRAGSLMPQFERCNSFDYERMKSGLLLIAQGLVKKLLIADRLAILVNTVYDSPVKFSGIHFVIATVFFTFQIYCDFSGYSDIAVGSARILGYSLINNFKRPYLSLSVSDFWRRWHISLTSWFRDYIYIPLGGNRKRHLFNVLIIFLISGLWHGASLTFVLWGLINGIYLVIGIKLKPLGERIRALLKISGTTLTYGFLRRLFTFALISFSWIFFRANNLLQLRLILSKLFTFNASFFANFSLISLGMDRYDILISFIVIIFLIIYETIQEKFSIGAILKNEPLIARWLVYATIITVIILFGVYGDANRAQFIYFKF
jgi:alginate O-acetyltransferase complex protein AlgI